MTPEKVEQKVVRVRRFDHKGDLAAMVEALRDEKFTGRLAFDFRKGGLAAVSAEDSQPISPGPLDLQ